MTKYLALPLLIFIGFFLWYGTDNLVFINTDIARDFFQNGGFFDTASRNIVTAIYLDYRLLDTLFEAGILLIAVSGISWIAQHEHIEHNPLFMLDKLKIPELFVSLARIVYPIILLFGIYIILNGHLAPGGGFQGGSVIASAILILYYIDLNKKTSINLILNIEKIIYIGFLLIAFISFFTRDSLFTNFIPLQQDPEIRALFLVLLNVLIGSKVAIGLTAIFVGFLKEGR